MKATEWAAKIGDLVKGYVDRAAAAIEGRLKALEDRTPEKGEAGTSVTIDDVRPLVEQAVSSIERPKDGASVTLEMVLPALIEEAKKAIAALPLPRDGKSVTVDDLAPMVESCVEAKTSAAVAKAIEALPKPKDGTSVTIDMVLPALTREAREAIAAIPRPNDGKSITVEDVAPLLRAMQAEWALDFERRAHESFQRAIDRMPAPKDGADGLGFEDVEQIEDGSTYGVRFKRGDRTIEFKWSKPTLADAYRGIFKEGERYARGDTATFGGSLFMATRATGSKPESDDSWRLVVKRGRDGKDWTPAK